MWFEQLIIHHHYVIYCLTNHITGGSDYSYNECVYYAVDVRCYDQMSLKLVRFFQLQILLITYCCQFLALQKLAIWLPNCDCVQLTSETSYSNKNIGVNALTKSSSNWYFFVLISCTPRHFLFEIKWKCVCLSITCFFKGKVWC